MHRCALICLLLITADIHFCSTASTPKCSRMPEGTGSNKSPPDGRFRLRIINDPIRFIPGESYNISLEGVTRYSAVSPQKFIGFFLTIERNEDKYYEDDDLGRFQILEPAISKISEKCNNLVVNTNTGPKSEVFVQWTAPTNLKGCIVLRSTIIEHRDIWFMDDGALSKTLCEDEADSFDLEPLVLKECNACEEAKYELTFEGLWSRNTHPKDFPDDGWLTKFSDVIGASHAIESSFWRYGDQSTEGMKNLAEHGATADLEEELKAKGDSIRTIVKARGLSYPNINGQTFAVFRVDAQHHLLSLVSKIYPSPDWFVGVNDLELCLANGQWVESKEVNLYPYDAGTDSGATYTAPDQPTLPRESVRRIKPNNPNDPRSPFYDPENKEMKPLAKLFITRQRLYEKECESRSNENNEGDEGEDNEADERNDDRDRRKMSRSEICKTQNWEPWSLCNNKCGMGLRIRRRYYVNSELAVRNGCNEELEQRQDCEGKDCGSPPSRQPSGRNDKNDDDGDSNQGEDEKEGEDDDEDDEEIEERIRNDPRCELTEWKEEECSCENGHGQKKMVRKFVKSGKYCISRYPSLKLVRMENCKTDCDSEATTKKIGVNCLLTDWSNWSICSTDCGRGQMIRLKKPMNKKNNNNDELMEIVQMYNKLNNGHYAREDLLKFDVTTVTDETHPCYSVQFVEAKMCGRYNKCEDDVEYICSQLPVRGKCNGEPELKFYYSVKNQDCGGYMDTGCPGNKNSFKNYTECVAFCKNPQIQEYDYRQNPLISEGLVKVKVDCQVSQWKYTSCNATCGNGHRWKYRKIIRPAENDGKACPMKLSQLERCTVNDDCEPLRTFRPQHVRATTQRSSAIYCEYSEWSSWSPCSKTCGHSAIQIRTRAVLNYENSAYCIERLEERPCPVLPCLMQNYNYRGRAYN